jgi:hypothetical protein
MRNSLHWRRHLVAHHAVVCACPAIVRERSSDSEPRRILFAIEPNTMLKSLLVTALLSSFAMLSFAQAPGALQESHAMHRHHHHHHHHHRHHHGHRVVR